MVRTIFVPKEKQMTLPIPDSYLGTRLEMLIFPIEDETVSVFPDAAWEKTFKLLQDSMDEEVSGNPERITLNAPEQQRLA
jgi:hypothetical protein